MRLAPRWRWFGAIAAVVVVADQLTKAWARGLPVDARGRGVPVPFIDGFWDWRLSYNEGIAFGLFHGTTGARVFLSLVGLAILGVIVWLAHKSRDDQRLTVWGLGLVAGGAIGNLIDRIGVGRVTDFVVWRYQEHAWPSFNVADVALVVGVGLMLLDGGGREGTRARGAAAR